MTRIIYLSLLLTIPFLVSAEHGRDILNGKWISPFHGKEIKIKVKRNEIRIKNLSKRGWNSFRPTRRGMFKDRNGNTIRLKNSHELTYRGIYRGDRMRFVKKGHNPHNHVCNRNCAFDNGYFEDSGFNNTHHGDHHYSDYSGYDDYDYYKDDRDTRWSSRNDRGLNNKGLSGRYFVREINEHIVIEDTRDGLRARRGNQEWKYYEQNKYRKNEYVDARGNKYHVRSDRSIIWRNRTGSVSLNLTQ